ncbi:unnamed protein product [Toxocara canis]|uniref:Uncharacterized protein n=1 Tax=Toxocara canis TaxID=6265 RepID=A0A183URQ2_TOXCA|nr:unnamed protein product [Toxocara canis]
MNCALVSRINCGGRECPVPGTSKSKFGSHVQLRDDWPARRGFTAIVPATFDIVYIHASRSSSSSSSSSSVAACTSSNSVASRRVKSDERKWTSSVRVSCCAAMCVCAVQRSEKRASKNACKSEREFAEGTYVLWRVLDAERASRLADPPGWCTISRERFAGQTRQFCVAPR